MLRPIDMADLPQEFDRMRILNETRGTPFLKGYLERILSDGWLERNSYIYRLYEIDGTLYGYWCLIPLTPMAYEEFVAGPRCPWRDLTVKDILPESVYREAITARQPIHVWIESFTHTDDHAFRIVGHDLLQRLQELAISGLLAESSSVNSETNCRFFGLELLRSYDRCPTGTRRVWIAPATAIAHPEWPYGPPTRSLDLSKRQKQVAYWFYIHTPKDGPPTADHVGRILGISEDAVDDHLKKIRAKAGEIIGTSDRNRLALWFHLHPSEYKAESTQASADYPTG
jgi:DNA-binding CsgD family transcriptional regulator